MSPFSSHSSKHLSSRSSSVQAAAAAAAAAQAAFSYGMNIDVEKLNKRRRRGQLLEAREREADETSGSGSGSGHESGSSGKDTDSAPEQPKDLLAEVDPAEMISSVLASLASGPSLFEGERERKMRGEQSSVSEMHLNELDDLGPLELPAVEQEKPTDAAPLLNTESKMFGESIQSSKKSGYDISLSEESSSSLAVSKSDLLTGKANTQKLDPLVAVAKPVPQGSKERAENERDPLSDEMLLNAGEGSCLSSLEGIAADRSLEDNGTVSTDEGSYSDTHPLNRRGSRLAGSIQSSSQSEGGSGRKGFGESKARAKNRKGRSRNEAHSVKTAGKGFEFGNEENEDEEEEGTQGFVGSMLSALSGGKSNADTRQTYSASHASTNLLSAKASSSVQQKGANELPRPETIFDDEEDDNSSIDGLGIAPATTKKLMNGTSLLQDSDDEGDNSKDSDDEARLL